MSGALLKKSGSLWLEDRSKEYIVPIRILHGLADVMNTRKRLIAPLYPAMLQVNPVGGSKAHEALLGSISDVPKELNKGSANWYDWAGIAETLPECLS
jgi:hypothetical protein